MNIVIAVFDWAALVLSFLGGCIIIFGAIYATFHLVLEILGKKHKGRGLNIDHIRIEFGRNIVLALEFFIAADIIESFVVPDYYEIGLLAVLVLIRTVLSYFLNRELEQLTEQDRQKLR